MPSFSRHLARAGRRLLSAVALLFALSSLTASANVAISSSGPMTQIGLTNDGNVWFNYLGWSNPGFFGATASMWGVYVVEDNALYMPSNIPSGTDVTGTSWTVVSQTPVSGSGVPTDPFIISIKIETATHLRATALASYVTGADHFDMRFTVFNDNPADRNVRVFFGADTYVKNSDVGYCVHDAATGMVGSISTDNSIWNVFVSNSPPASRYIAGEYSTVWAAISSHQLPNTVEGGTPDNGAALEWDLLVPGLGSRIVDMSVVVEPPWLLLLAKDLPVGALGTTYAPQTLQTVFGVAPVSFAVTGGALPPGLRLGPTTGTIAGTPTAVGEYQFTVTATDSWLPASQTTSDAYVITIKDPLGSSCAAGATCASGYCGDGVCCDSACTDQCQACSAAGLCTTLVLNETPRAPRLSCTNAGSAPCGGFCSGTSDTCAYPIVSCRPASCDPVTSQATIPVSCDGAGQCPAVVTVPCRYGCDGDGCRTHCVLDDDCGVRAWCSAGTCADKKPDGETCDRTRMCLSGSCADGVCCDSDCDGQCESCGVAGSVGACSAAPNGQPVGGRPACGPGNACDAFCDGVSHGCVYPVAECRPVSCDPATSQVTAPASCDGAGQCPAVVRVPCRYGCDGDKCRTHCTLDGDCGLDAWCNAGTCADRKPIGVTCDAPHVCDSGFCVDGVCCDTACDEPAQCGGDAIVAAPTCGQGVCARPEPKSCGKYACEMSETGPACAVSCETNEDCAQGFSCVKGQCEIQTGPKAASGDHGVGGCSTADGESRAALAPLVLIALAWMLRSRRSATVLKTQ